MRDLRRRAALAIGAAALVGMSAWLVPSTSGSFTAAVTNTSNTANAANQFKCADTFTATKASSNAYFEWSLTDSSSTTATDTSSASNSGIYEGSHATDIASPTACPHDSTTSALSLNGSSQFVTATNTATMTATTPFSLSIWFKTTSATTGALIGFIGSQTGTSSTYDRILSVQSSGQVSLYTYNGTATTLSSPSGTSYIDGVWHQAVATFSSAAGVVLYVDGAKVAASASTTAAENASGRYWRVGWDGNHYFTGSVKYAAAYNATLTAAEVRSRYTIGTPS